MYDQLNILLDVVITTGLCAIVGYEREEMSTSAGLNIHFNSLSFKKRPQIVKYDDWITIFYIKNTIAGTSFRVFCCTFAE